MCSLLIHTFGILRKTKQYIYRPFHIISYVTNNHKMEYTTDEYKRSIGKVFTTSDGNKYIQSKLKGNYIYLRCILFRSKCKGTSKLNCETGLITPLGQHNHDVDEYRSEVYHLKTKCKTIAKKFSSQPPKGI